MANQYTKFEVARFSRSRDILGGLKIQMYHVTITTPLLSEIRHPFGSTWYSLYLCTKFDNPIAWAIYQIWLRPPKF